jgi:anti-anti-sigma regulatory factor
VQFSDAQALSDAAASELREDLAQLAEDMDRDSRILLDFTGIEPFDPAAIEALVVFDKKLRVRGSRMVLCCLAPEAREAVFAACAS